ncbi:unnamed protein product [Timema podura]|uniref:BTB domain-containing protein n=1 Tax=Timema podura TaxID=61482 RepID=A0ABN7PCN0_TIMPD|nr:unnamed protein product [Timema podura]
MKHANNGKLDEALLNDFKSRHGIDKRFEVSSIDSAVAVDPCRSTQKKDIHLQSNISLSQTFDDIAQSPTGMASMNQGFSEPLLEVSSEVCLKWNNYYSNMETFFPSMLTNEKFVDVTLSAGGHSIKCHKAILAACSPYFEQLLSDNPCQHPIIIMKDSTFWEIQALVHFMYCGEVNVAKDKLSSLLGAAESLKIKGLAGNLSVPPSYDDYLPTQVSLAPEDYLIEEHAYLSAPKSRKRRVSASHFHKQDTMSDMRSLVSPRSAICMHYDSEQISESPVQRSQDSHVRPTLEMIKSEPEYFDIDQRSFEEDGKFDRPNKVMDGENTTKAESMIGLDTKQEKRMKSCANQEFVKDFDCHSGNIDNKLELMKNMDNILFIRSSKRLRPWVESISPGSSTQFAQSFTFGLGTIQTARQAIKNDLEGWLGQVADTTWTNC